MSRSALARAKPKSAPPLPGAAPVAPVAPIAPYATGHSMYPGQQMYYTTDMYGTGVVPQAGMMYPQYMQIPYQQQPLYPTPQPDPSVQTQEEEQVKKKEELPIHGNQSTYNINTLLYNNIMESEYFQALYQLETYHQVIDEIYTSVSHVEPWQTGTSRVPSTAFCLLMKFLVMRLTKKQMKGLLNTGDSAYVRAIGFLYLRYTCPPTDLFSWFEPYLEDEEEFAPSSDVSVTVTMGSYLINLLSDMHYYNTTLPRIPVPIERKMKVMLLMLGEKQKRRLANQKDEDRGKFVKGAKVSAIYSDEDNEPAWYDAVIDSRDREGEQNAVGGGHRYWVTFTAYGNSESVDLGDMKLLGGSAGDGEGRGGSRSRSKEGRKDDKGKGVDLLTQVLDRERQGSVAVGKNYGSRPVSYKSSLSLQLDRYTVRQKSPSRVAAAETGSRSNHHHHRDGRGDRSRSRDRDGRRGDRSRDRRDRDRDRHRDRDRDRDRHRDSHHRGSGSGSGQSSMTVPSSSSSSYTSGQSGSSSAQQVERMKRLKDMYGDASANGN